MKYDFAIFGGTGIQGRICARDLIKNGYSVMLIGRDPSMIQGLLKNPKATFLKADLRNTKEIEEAIKKSGSNIIIDCAEYTFNLAILKACAKYGRHCTDLGGPQTENLKSYKFNKQFKEKGIMNLTGCGSTPGISSVMVSYAAKFFDKINTIYAGFAWDSNIKKFVIPYSMPTIFDEFTERPHIFENGKIKRIEPLKHFEIYNFEGIGKQKVYCISHTEVITFARAFKDKGIKHVRYFAGFPEHSFSVIKTLMDLRFHSKRAIKFNNEHIRPLDFTTQLMKRIVYPKGYKEIENIWVKVKGEKDGKKKDSEMNCLVKTLSGWESAGSNVDTGMTISIMSQMLKKGLIRGSGVMAPESVVPHTEFFNELAKRKMYVLHDGKRIN